MRTMSAVKGRRGSIGRFVNLDQGNGFNCSVIAILNALVAHLKTPLGVRNVVPIRIGRWKGE